MTNPPQQVSSFTVPSSGPPQATVSIVGDAYDNLQTLKAQLINASSDAEVVMLALGLLQLAQGKQINIIDGNGRTQVVELWKNRS
ncbi:hypothetical protein ACSMXN_05280 [Jatrophihabitans sp. DSM 45814]